MATPEKSRRTYIGLKGHLTRLLNKSETLSKATPIDYNKLKVSENSDPEDIDQAIADNDTQDKFNVLHDIVDKHKLNPNANISQFSVLLSEARLPTLDLPTFAGLDEENWDTFWTSFEVHIHSKPSIDKVYKFSYLNSLLKGEAKKVINNLALTASNYSEAIKLLKLNYHNTELSIANLYYQLLDMKAPSNRPDSLQTFRLEVESLVKALGTKVNVPASEWSIKLLLHRKLPRSVLAEIYSHYKTEFLTLGQIFEGLRITVNRLKTHDKIKPESKQPNTENSVKTKSTLNTSSKFKPKPTPSTGKRSSNIGIYSVSPSETVVDASNKKTSTTRERKCNKGAHHHALCRKAQLNSTNPRKDSTNSTSVQYCKVHQEINVLATESGNNTTLPTTQLKLINKKSRVNTRGLFDQSSQKTFITKHLVEQLKLKAANRVRLNISGFLANSGPREYEVVKLLVRLGSSTSPIYAIVMDKIP
nr:uncharacterized protein LOC123753252 [Procambarus clarkii]